MAPVKLHLLRRIGRWSLLLLLHAFEDLPQINLRFLSHRLGSLSAVHRPEPHARTGHAARLFLLFGAGCQPARLGRLGGFGGDQLLDGPDMIGEPCLHRRGDAQALVYAAPVEPRDEDRHHHRVVAHGIAVPRPAPHEAP